MGIVISIDEVRAKRAERQQLLDPRVDKSFVAAWQATFEALELVETIPLPKAARARELLLRGLEVMLERETRRLGQWAN
ncbi:hypothetical protein NLY43_24135 [Mesorhizobium sp. C416B]|uniref:hypothetical protein n=1 Tax=unclassified Mesorhizobium TaxID=325217 RepID=UPI0003CE8130|nr:MULTISPECIES: hypothetical protein [unclassified Mesorhizobium]ESX48817.1 hypothetical protein X762_10970 [Mesorhizobium sp. LSHC426A00]ESX55551.1 hypothetical protein X761_14035 [Mesorhizobium sp. LSHC424B00]ESX70294.1 hypothetical protein X758_16880 [Mesorhizobium sp. LSHC416B00]WJI61676.1 hypothetical protein NLY43_24135 [Mesorhizobium sp. C416B]